MQSKVKAVSAQIRHGYLEIVFNIGMCGRWPLRILQFAKCTDRVLTDFYPNAEEVSEVEVWPSGEVVEFSRVDQAFRLSALMPGDVRLIAVYIPG